MSTTTHNVKTWADGFGIWHASVAHPGGPTPSAAREARRMIRDELAMRGELGAGYRVCVEYVRATGHGTLIYREVSLT